MDHVGITISTSHQAYNEKVTKFVPPQRINLPDTHPRHRKRNNQAKVAIASEFDRLWDEHYLRNFNKCLSTDDYEGASVLWHAACETTLLHAFSHVEGQSAVDKPPRGTTLLRQQVDLAATLDVLQSQAKSSHTAVVQRYIGMLKDLKARVRRWLTPIDQPISDDNKHKPIAFCPNTQDVHHNARPDTAEEQAIAVKHLATICNDGPLLHHDSLGVELNKDDETYTITPQQLEDEIQRTISPAKTTANQLRTD